MATFTIGRSDDNTIVLSETTVSRQHAELETRKRGSYVLRDLDSTYGTRIFRDGEWLNIIEVEVTDETEVTFGEYRSTIGEIVAMAAGAPGAAAAPAVAAAPVAPAPVKSAAEPTPAAAPSRHPTPAPSGATGADKRMTMMILIGGGALLLLVVIVAVAIVLTGGSGPTTSRTAAIQPSTATTPSTPPNPSNPSTPSNPATGDRAAFEARLVKGCTRQGRLDTGKCQCIAKHISEALTREELAIFVALRNVKGDQGKVREIMQRYGATKVAAIGTKMVAVVAEVQKQCGVTLNR